MLRLKEMRKARRKRREELRSRTIAPHMVWNKQPFYVDARETYGNISGIPDIRLFFLQSAIRSLENVPGDLAECGTRNGKSALFMLHAMAQQRKMYLFDSFEGLSDPTPGQDTLASAIDERTGERIFHTADPEVVVRRFDGMDVDIKTGWIPERFPEVADREFCLVHIDVDLYQPTRDAIEFFFPLMAPHAMLICDDYGSGNYPGARNAMDEYFAHRPEGIIELPQGQAFVIKRPS